MKVLDLGSGAGDVVNLGFAQISASVAANSTDSDGAGGGFAAIIPSVLSPHLSDNGPVTCMNVIGNRATVGFVGSNGVDGEPYPRLLFIEDNGPTGDLIGFGTMAEPYTKCPPPTSDSFILPNGFPGLLTSGNFTVQPGPGA